MGDIAIPGGSGGSGGSDECTATLDYVLQGKTAITSDSGDEPGVGRMSVKGAQTFAPGRFNQTIGAGQYLAGEQTIQGDANLLAHYIKKGVTIFGVTGTWDGFVADAQDMYYMGNNPAGLRPINGGSMESNMICTKVNPRYTIAGTEHECIQSTRAYNLTPFQYLQIEGYSESDSAYAVVKTIKDGNISSGGIGTDFSRGNFNVRVNISSLNLTCQIEIRFISNITNEINKSLNVHRVRLI